MSVKTVQVQIMPSTAWIDMPAVLSNGMTITRGKADLASSISAGTLSLTGDNSGGAWTPYRGLRIPIRVLVNGSVRFTGTTQTWGQSWPTGSVTREDLSITAVDVLARLERAVSDTITQNLIKSLSPVFYYPMTEGQAPAVDASGNGWPDLKPLQIGSGGSIGWAQGSGAPTDGSSTVQLSPVGTRSGVILTQGSHTHTSTSIGQITIHFLMSTTQLLGETLFCLSSPLVDAMGDWAFRVIVGPGYQGVPSIILYRMIADDFNATPLASLTSGDVISVTVRVGPTITPGGGTDPYDQYCVFIGKDNVYPSGGSYGSLSIPVSGPWRLQVGGSSATFGTTGLDSDALFSGSIGHVAMWNRALTDTEIGNIVEAEQTGLSEPGSSALARWANAAGVTQRNFDAPTDSSEWVTTSLESPADLFRAAEVTEGGWVYASRANYLRFFARSSTNLPAGAAAVSDLFPSSFTSTFGTAAVATPLTLDMLSPDGEIMTDWSTAMGSAVGTSTSGSSVTIVNATDPDLQQGSIGTVAASDDQNRRATENFLYSNTSPTKMPALTVDLQALTGDNALGSPGTSDSHLGWIQAMDIGSTIQISGLPGRPDPDPYQLLGYTETISHDTWSMSMNVNGVGQGTRGDLLVLDDPTQGVLDSTHRIDW